MTENTIQINTNKGIKLTLVDSEGIATGEYLEFDLEATDLLLIYQDMIESMKKHKIKLNNRLSIIEKQEDHKGKKMLSSREESMISALNDFYKEMEQDYNMFLGENGVKKLLNGKKLGWTSFKMIDEIIEKQILPYIEKNMKSIEEEIKEMAKVNSFGNDNVLK